MGIESVPLHSTALHISSEVVKEKDIEIEIGNKDELKAAGDSVKKSRKESLLGLNDQHDQCRAAALINLKYEEKVVVGKVRYIRTSEGVLLERGSALRVGAKARRMFLYAAALLRYNTAECGQSACIMSACLSCCSSCQATEICLCVCLHSSRIVFAVLIVACSAVQCSVGCDSAHNPSHYILQSYISHSQYYLHLFCLPYSKCLTVKPANPEALGLLADVLGKAMDESLCPFMPTR